METIEDVNPLISTENDTNIDILTRENGSIKTHVHVAPRIDQDLYQADVPDWCSNYRDNYFDSRPQHRSASSEKNTDHQCVKEFLAATRNLFNYTRPTNNKTLWNTSSADIPLESDVFALEYLASYDYNIDKAYFNIFCDLGCGKDAIYTGKTLGIAERLSSGLIFSECKDKLFRVPPLTLLGTYETMLQSNIHRPIDNEVGGVVSVSVPVSLCRETDMNVDQYQDDDLFLNNTPLKEYQLFSSLITCPLRSQSDIYLLSSMNDKKTDTVIELVSEESLLLQTNNTLPNNKKKNENINSSRINLKTTNLLIDSKDEDKSNSNNARISKPRGVANDKLELRKKWITIAKQANHMMHPPTPSTSKATLQDAQSLLELGISLPPYFANVSALTSSSNDEHLLIENARIYLGELLKSILISRYWISEMRDSIYCCWINAVIYATIQSRTSFKGNSESLIGGLKELLKESQALQLRPEKEQIELKQIISVTEDLLKSARKILTFCSAWEMKNISMDVSESFLTSIYSTQVLAKRDISALDGNGARPAVFSAVQIRTLLRQYPLGETFYALDQIKPTMLEVAEFLRLASLNPVKITEVVYIADIYRIGLQQEALAATILTRASQLDVAKSRLTLERTRYSLVEVQSLLKFLHLFPFRSEEVDALQKLLSRAETWRAEVMNLNGTENGRENNLAPKPIPLLKVEALITEGERLPFEFKKELEILRDKKSQAKVWLEKLKKSFVPLKSVSRHRKSTTVEDAQQSEVANTEKISLSDMKMMVSEGEMLFQPLVVNQDSKNGLRTFNRDLDKAVAVVETAEDWVSRARDLLLRDPNELSSIEKDENVIGTADEDDEEEDVPEYSILMLRTMLQEAEGMPVVMEEVNALKCHLNALEWAEKVRPFLLLDSDVALIENNSPTKDEEKSAAPNKQKSKKITKVGHVKPRLSELQQFAKEITKIRSSFTGSVKIEIPFRPSQEEIKCIETVAEAEKWLNKKKKIQQGNNIRKGIKLSRLKCLYDEALSMNVNFEYELRPLKSALKSVESWLEDNFLILSRLELLDTASDTLLFEQLIEKCKDLKMDTLLDVSYSDLVSLSSSASQLLVDFDVSRAAQTFLNTVNEWLLKVKRIVDIFHASASNASKISHIPNNLHLIATNEEVATAITSVSLPPTLCSLEEFENLIRVGNNLKVNFDEELNYLVKVKQSALLWADDVQTTQLPLFADSLVKGFEEYDRFIIEDTAPFSNILFSFIDNNIIHINDDQVDKKQLLDREKLFYEDLDQLDHKVNRMIEEGQGFGVEMPILRLLLTFSGTFNWLKETRNLSRLSIISRRKALSQIKTLRNVNEESWEDLQNPIHLEFWGEVDLFTVKALIHEGSAILQTLSRSGAVISIVSLYNSVNSVFKDINNFTSLEDIDDPDSDFDAEVDDTTVYNNSDQNEIIRTIDSNNTVSGTKRKRVLSSKLDADSQVISKASRSSSSNLNKNNKSNSTTDSHDLNSSTNLELPAGVEVIADEKMNVNKIKMIDTENKSLNKMDLVNINHTKMLNRTLFLKSLNEISTEDITSRYSSYRQSFSALVKSVDLWLRILKLFSIRLKALNIWSDKVCLLLQTFQSSESYEISPDSIVKTEDAFELLLKESDENNYLNKQRVSLMEIIENSKSWISKAKHVLNTSNNESWMNIEELTLFIKNADTVIYAQERSSLLSQLRIELKKAKQWLIKFEKSGASSGGSSSDVTDALLEDAKSIRVNLSEQTDTIVQSYKTYCLCRNLYFGTMIGCDTCEEWYHVQCVGLNTQQSNLSSRSKYVCIRCSLKESFTNSINNAAQITNKWMNCKDHFQNRDSQFQKLTKRIQKEEKELIKIREILKSEVTVDKESLDDSAIHQSSENDLPLVSSSTAASGLPSNSSEIPYKMKELDFLQNTLDKSLKEKDTLMRNIAAETQHHKEIIRWMQALQELIWPCNEEQIFLAKPLGPTVLITTDNPLSLLSYSRNIVEKLNSLLPVGLVHMERASSIVGIAEIEDVIIVLNIFRWLSWVNLALHLLRYPPTSVSLRRLLNASENIAVKDEKTIKLLNVILQRIGAWKSKVRKHFNSSKSWIDTIKLNAIVLEGNNFPFTSRIKNRLQQILTDHHLHNTNNKKGGTTSSSGVHITTHHQILVAAEDHTEQKNTVPKKRGPKPQSLQIVDESSCNIKFIDLCISSDEEEDEYESDTIAQTTSPSCELMDVQTNDKNNSKQQNKSIHYENMNPQLLAADPNISWPPILKVARIILNNNILS